MTKDEFNKAKLTSYYLESSNDDFDTMLSLFENKRYNWALFVGHLSIEKLLKALYVNTNNDFPPFIHNLLRLSEMCNLELSEEQKLFMVTVTTFNINTRYDDYKMSFQKRCTPEFTKEWVEKIKLNREWIKKLIT
jgi:HEPN domain-containing protein